MRPSLVLAGVLERVTGGHGKIVFAPAAQNRHVSLPNHTCPQSGRLKQLFVILQQPAGELLFSSNSSITSPRRKRSLLGSRHETFALVSVARMALLICSILRVLHISYHFLLDNILVVSCSKRETMNISSPVLFSGSCSQLPKAARAGRCWAFMELTELKRDEEFFLCWHVGIP